ncbi:hypothetical protein CC86DRAFT_411065 [Ophiobolus disseminans]|uniref:Uncharacterized protein n=1 Tax=Ophiobolus disseminans TaxID=1469910 RepID=A0A6A6ZJU0_9PLEO|nr:hypothetical protein CC86DRAFT_411065 [Ophiobolus disseminans]
MVIRFLLSVIALAGFALASQPDEDSTIPALEPPTYTLSVPEELAVLTMRRNDLSKRIEMQSRLYDTCMAVKHDLMLLYVTVSTDSSGEKKAAREVWEEFSCWDVQLPLVDMEQESNNLEERVGELEAVEELEEQEHGKLRGLEEDLHELCELEEISRELFLANHNTSSNTHHYKKTTAAMVSFSRVIAMGLMATSLLNYLTAAATPAPDFALAGLVLVYNAALPAMKMLAVCKDSNENTKLVEQLQKQTNVSLEMYLDSDVENMWLKV